MKRARNLFNLIISDENISFAIDEVNRSHRWRKNHRPNPTVAWVEETKPERIRELQKILLSGFTPSPCKKSTRWDANARKWREINEPKLYPDQYIHHALIQVLQPVVYARDGLLLLWQRSGKRYLPCYAWDTVLDAPRPERHKMVLDL